MLRRLPLLALFLGLGALVSTAGADERTPVEWDRDLRAVCVDAGRAFHAAASERGEELERVDGVQARLLLSALRYDPTLASARRELGQTRGPDGAWTWTASGREALIRAVTCDPVEWTVELDDRVEQIGRAGAVELAALAAEARTRTQSDDGVWSPRSREAELWALDLATSEDTLVAAGAAVEVLRDDRLERILAARAAADARWAELDARTYAPRTGASDGILAQAGLVAREAASDRLAIETTFDEDAAVAWHDAGRRALDDLEDRGLVTAEELPSDAVRRVVVVRRRVDFEAACAVAGWNPESIRTAADTYAAVYLRPDVVLVRATSEEDAAAWVVRYVVRSALRRQEPAGDRVTEWEPWLTTALTDELVARHAGSTAGTLRRTDADTCVVAPDATATRLRLLTAAGVVRPVAELTELGLDDLTAADRLEARAFLRMLADLHAAVATELLRDAATDGTLVAVERHLGLSPDQLDGELQGWLRLCRRIAALDE